MVADAAVVVVVDEIERAQWVGFHQHGETQVYYVVWSPHAKRPFVVVPSNALALVRPPCLHKATG